MPTSALKLLGAVSFLLMYRFSHGVRTPFWVLGSLEIVHCGEKRSFSIYSCLDDSKIFRNRRGGKEINEQK